MIFVIGTDEDGTDIATFEDIEKFREYLQEYWFEEEINVNKLYTKDELLNDLVENRNLFYSNVNKLIVIEGDVLELEPEETVKTYRIKKKK